MDIFIETELPKPLSKKELLECFKQFYLGNMEAREKIIIHNIKLVFKRVYKMNLFSIPKEELISTGIIGLIKAVDTFDINKNIEFSTYAMTCINNEILIFLRNENKIKTESLDNMIFEQDGQPLTYKDILVDENDTSFLECENEEIRQEIINYIETLPFREKEMIKLYFGFYDRKYTQPEIGTMFDIAQTRVSRIIKSGVIEIGRHLVSLKMIEPVKRLQKYK